jgi:hypothetical protein
VTARYPGIPDEHRFPQAFALPSECIGDVMTIHRRQLLGSLAAAGVCAPALTGLDAARAAPAHPLGSQANNGWLLTRDVGEQVQDHGVDFWTRPFSDIDYPLPPQIIRGTMGFDDLSQHASALLRCFDGADRTSRHALCAPHNEALASALQSLVLPLGSGAPRTALLALDSMTFNPLPEPRWAEVIPAFRSCYRNIIGHFHIPERGLRQWRQLLSADSDSDRDGDYFREFFMDAAMQCDAVIVTSDALCECDVWCSAKASTKALAGDLMRDLGCALLAPDVLGRVLRNSSNAGRRSPRFFALASLELDNIDSYQLYAPLLSSRQAALVRGSFGESTGEHFMMVATACADIQSDLVAELRKQADDYFFATTIPAYEVAKSDHHFFNHLRSIILWPFAFDADEKIL